MAVHWDHLDAATRKRLAPVLGDAEAESSRETATPPAATTKERGELECACGQRFVAYATAERHANEAGHHRIHNVLPAQ